jgi:predicted ferric reductase
MARALDGATGDVTGGAREIDLYYCTDRADDEYFVDELYAIADRHPRFRVIPIRKTDLGHITAVDVRGANPLLGDQDLFVCGPPAMQRNLTAQFRALGVPSGLIHYEDFGSLAT